MDRDRAVPRGGRRLLVDRAERDRARAGAVRPRGRRARHRRRRARVRPQARGVPLRAARAAAARPGLGAHDRAARPLRDRGRDPDRAAEGARGRRAGRESPPRSTARRSTTGCTPRCGSSACGARSATRPRSTSCGRTRSACSQPELRPALAERFGRDGGRGGRALGARRRVRGALGGDDDGAPLGPGGCAMVTEAAVWEALAEIPDPEIPVISLVDLGVVKDVAVEGERVRIEFTPTFMGCPALDAMRAQMEAAVTALGGEPRGRRLARRLLVDRQDHAGRPREAARGRLRASGAARRGDARRCCSSRRPSTAARTAARRRRGSTTSSARPRAARCATARAAGSRSSSSRRSDVPSLRGRRRKP